ncbi:hypothetical protein COJ36_20410 [Priestia megaterium]|uniref:DUF4127 family protein n=2 Tax=Priestia megaterium TaxID=1404 RepID=UPI000BFA6E1F|nr:DUF4127 family protein [Priestia megaterium]PFL64395.1 hypothetical protein COJ36_20410 [Priestia megaterium]
MNKIMYLPLDERPCNYKFPVKLAELTDLELIVPNRSLLGNKKKPADVSGLQEWLLENCQDASYLIVSIDMLVYGGIVPSRIHNLTKEECINRVNILNEIKALNPTIKIYAFNLILRVSSNDRDEEEPFYYKNYGNKIWNYGWLTDKEEREGLIPEEKVHYNKLKETIPSEYLEDFIERRKKNKALNHYVLEMVEQGALTELIVPLDDNSKYGFTAKEQKELLFRVNELDISHKVLIYPGADDLGCSLFSKVFCDVKKYSPEIYVRYSSTWGPFMKPKYEDRSLHESLKSQIIAAGGFIIDHSYDTNIILMVNSPATEQWNMAEQVPFNTRHATYFSEVNYREFIEAIKMYLGKGKNVSLADVAVCNGSDTYLMNLLKKNNLINELSSYAGWNTSGNTLGTVIPHTIIHSYYNNYGSNKEKLKKDREFYLHRLVEDWGYQGVVRNDIIENHLPVLKASYFEVKHVQKDVEELVKNKIMDFVRDNFDSDNLLITNVNLPWVRMFEIDFELDLKLNKTFAGLIQN